MKRAATTLMLMLAAVASAAVVDVERASWREGEGGKTQWAPTRSFRGLNAHPVFTGERGRAASPYAGEEGETAAGGKEAGFTGHRTESALGLTYAEQRWLDSSTGTWLSRDPVGASSYLARPNELYAFGYAAGNPTRFVDPDGRCAIIPGSGDMSCFSADTWSLALQDRTRMGFVFTGYLQRKMEREGNQNLAVLAGMTHMSASVAVTAWGDERTFAHGERLEAFHATNMLNPAYASLFHGKTMLDIDARRRAEGGYSRKTAGAMAENSLYFALDVTGLYGMSRSGAAWGQQQLGPAFETPQMSHLAASEESVVLGPLRREASWWSGLFEWDHAQVSMFAPPLRLRRNLLYDKNGDLITRPTSSEAPPAEAFEYDGVGVPKLAGGVRNPSSVNYGVFYEAQLPRGVGTTRGAHFAEANRQLYEAMQADPAFAAQLEAQLPGISQGVAPGPRGAFKQGPPINSVTWHHGPLTQPPSSIPFAPQPGRLQLMLLSEHTAPGPIQSSLHPGGVGGMEQWGGWW